MSTASQWVLLWSRRQNCFHIEPAGELLEKNALAMVADRPINDYHPVYMGPREACERAAENSRHLLKKREASHVH